MLSEEGDREHGAGWLSIEASRSNKAEEAAHGGFQKREQESRSSSRKLLAVAQRRQEKEQTCWDQIQELCMDTGAQGHVVPSGNDKQ